MTLADRIFNMLDEHSNLTMPQKRQQVREMIDVEFGAAYSAGAEAGWKAYETALAAMRANGVSPELKPLMILPEPP